MDNLSPSNSKLVVRAITNVSLEVIRKFEELDLRHYARLFKIDGQPIPHTIQALALVADGIIKKF